MNKLSSIDRTMLQDVCYTKLPEREILVKIARLYADAFADEPWNEYKVCKNDHYFGRKCEYLTKCTSCDEPVELAYPEGKMVDYITKEVEKPNGTLIIFEDQGKEVYAAGWGYVCTIEELKAKYKTPEMQGKIEAAIKKTALKVDKIFYLSEIMVDTRVRKQGIATEIFDRLSKRTKELELEMVMRTHNESPMAIIAQKRAMPRIIDVGNDTEIVGRVLYMTT